jgi:hypothetical protein
VPKVFSGAKGILDPESLRNQLLESDSASSSVSWLQIRAHMDSTADRSILLRIARQDCASPMRASQLVGSSADGLSSPSGLPRGR